MKTPPLRVDAEAQVEMLPLIDVVFLVLAAFIYASTFLTPRTGLTVALPQAGQAKMQNASAVTVTIRRDGHLFLGDKPVAVANLNQLLSAQHRLHADDSVVVNGDRRAQIGLLVRVMDAARTAGFKRLTIAARDQAQAAAAVPQ